MSQLPPPQQHTASVWHPDVLERAHTAFVTLLTVDRMSNDKSGTWPNHRIHAFKAKALPSGSTNGRGFGSVFRHQYPKSHPLSVGIFFARSPSVGAVSGPGFANVLVAISFVGEGLKVWLEHAGDQAQ